MSYTVVMDAGHGGTDSGAISEERQEKDDTLRLVLAVGSKLECKGLNVEYTRVSDVYNTPYEKAMMANNADADLFISIHRNNTTDNSAFGAETIIYDKNGMRSVLANHINDKLEEIGFKNLGVRERPNLLVLSLTKMPSVLVNVGSINSQSDNEIFDSQFESIANAISESILDTIMMDPQKVKKLYRVQVGAYRKKDTAFRQMEQLQREGYQGFIVFMDELYKVQVGAFELLENAIKMEQSLRNAGYSTYIVTS